MDISTVPRLLDLQFRGFVEGATIKSKSSGKDLCHYFGGIPYALPPVGPYRWRRPRPLPPCYRYGTFANPGNCAGEASKCPQPDVVSPLDDEDCLQCNIFIPAGQAPEEGWPVYFYIHGGFLQKGTASDGDPTALLSETPFKAIIVKPAYRLNIFGFLASTELLTEANNTEKTVGNLGFWDLRLALEWTHKNINYFNGNPTNITVGGYSAGVHAAFYQLAYDLEYQPEKRIIKRIIMHSNGPGVQPKSLEETQFQFDELLNVLGISMAFSGEEKLMHLREMDSKALVKAIRKMRLHQFRAVTDGVFVRPTLFQELEDGTFARKMLESNVQLLIGENSNEHFAYARYRTPTASFNSVLQRLEADYPRKLVQELAKHYFPGDNLPKKYESWKEAFGRVYSDIQVHVTQRGFLDALIRGGAERLIKRYRIEWRSKLAKTPKKEGATHVADQVIWWFGNGRRFNDEEEIIVREAFIEQFSAFVMGQEADWETEGPFQVRRLKADGSVGSWHDEFWEEKLVVWKIIMDATLSSRPSL